MKNADRAEQEKRWRGMLMREHPRALPLVRKELKRIGLLPHAGAEYPSVASLAAGEPVKGSWWGHPKGRLIWAVGEELAEREDVLLTKLLFGKQTWVHEKLWPFFLAVALSGGDWQGRALSPAARRLLSALEKAGTLRGDKTKLDGKAVTELERRLLVFSEEIHTASGAHARVLTDWRVWMKRKKIRVKPPAPEEAKAELEAAAGKLGPGASRGLPWR